MTKRRYYFPIMAAVIGLILVGCGGGGGHTITVTVSGPTISASERALGIGAAIAPLAEGETAPALRQITPAVERTAAGGVSVTVTADPVGPVYEFLDSTPLDDVWSRAGLRGSETGLTEHITLYTNIENPRRPFGSVYTLDEDNALTRRLCNPLDACAVFRVSPPQLRSGIRECGRTLLPGYVSRGGGHL